MDTKMAYVSLMCFPGMENKSVAANIPDCSVPSFRFERLSCIIDRSRISDVLIPLHSSLQELHSTEHLLWKKGSHL